MQTARYIVRSFNVKKRHMDLRLGDWGSSGGPLYDVITGDFGPTARNAAGLCFRPLRNGPVCSGQHRELSLADVEEA